MTGVTVVKLMFCMLTVFGSRKFFVLETWERLWHIDTNVKLFYIWRLTVESARSSLFWRPESEYHTLTLMSNGCCVCDSWQFFLFWRPESDYDTLTLMSNWCVWQQTFLCCRSLRVMITSWHWCQTDVCVVWQLTVLCSRGLRAMITSWHWCQTDVLCVTADGRQGAGATQVLRPGTAGVRGDIQHAQGPGWAGRCHSSCSLAFLS